MVFDKVKLGKKIDLLVARHRTLKMETNKVQHCCDALIEIQDVVIIVPDPNAPANTIGRTIKEKSTPIDEGTGSEITPTRRNTIYEKRMTEAATLLGHNV